MLENSLSHAMKYEQERNLGILFNLIQKKKVQALPRAGFWAIIIFH